MGLGLVFKGYVTINGVKVEGVLEDLEDAWAAITTFCWSSTPAYNPLVDL